MILGILPTVSNEFSVYMDFIKQMEQQTLKADLIAIGYQGTDENFLLLTEKLAKAAETIKTNFIKIQERSLARTKNILIDLYKDGFEYIFIYEDDVMYKKNYNEDMLNELLRAKADMISAVVEKKITFKEILYALLYTATHIYPLNDMRTLMMIIPFGLTITSRYLSGGFSMVKKKVFDYYQYDKRLLLYSLGEDIDFSFRVSERFKTVITNKVRCVHNSENVWKFKPTDSITSKVNLWSYFFNKNLMKKSYLPQYYCIIALNLIEAMAYSIKYRDAAIFKKAFRTFKLNRKGLYTSPFIEGHI